MTTLRWILCGILVLFAGGYLVLFILAGNVRRSFGGTETHTLLLTVSLFLVGTLAWWIAPGPDRSATLIAPAALAYPVLLVNEDKIAEICLDADELTLRPENTDHIIEQRFHVVAADGRRYGIVNFRQGERPSLPGRLSDASVFQSKHFRVTFDLRPDRVLSREEVLAQLRDRHWTIPATTATTLSELFIAYRYDRWREFGNTRDRMPDETQNF